MSNLPLPEELDFGTSSISANGDALYSTFTKRERTPKDYSNFNAVQLQAECEVIKELLNDTALFEPKYLMNMVETAKERLPSDFYVKICALAKLYYDENECLLKRLIKMSQQLPPAHQASSSTSTLPHPSRVKFRSIPMTEMSKMGEQLPADFILPHPSLVNFNDSEASSSTSAVIATPLNSLSSREVARRRQQTPLRPSIQGGIHSFEMSFHCGLYPIHKSIFHCLCGKILYGNWQIQWQEHITSEVHTTWTRFFLDMTADVQLFHLNQNWDFSIPTESDKSLILHYKGDYGNEGENDEADVNEESRHEAEVKLKFAESNNGLHRWIGNEIILVVHPI